MSNATLQTFIEDRLLAFDPSIDVSSGSPVQTQFIQPLLAKLGTDPFQTDIDSFILDRFSQEFPDIYAGDPSAVRDIFIKPLIILLDPFRREIQNISTNQSFIDPTLLSDDDADALAANLFVDRNSGGFSRGIGRIFFANPINIQIEITTTFSTANGLNFFPTDPLSITAEEMVFNRSGSLFFADVALISEQEGTQYNIDKNELAAVGGVFGAVKVGNPSPFINGATKTDTTTFISQAKESLTERSLVTRRGATTVLNNTFPGQSRAIQVIGANDIEMQRDILVATSHGHSWLTGTVNLYNKVAFVQIKVVDGNLSDSPAIGDTLFVYLDPYSYSGTWAGLNQASRLLTFTIEEILISSTDATTPYQVSYFVQWSGTIPTGITLPNPVILEGGFRKKGIINVSSIPDTGKVSLVVPNETVHLFGHSDVYVRPVTQDVSTDVISSVHDSKSFVERTSLATVSGNNNVQDTGFDFLASGVQAGDQLIIETGGDAGTYSILSVTGGSPSYLYLNSGMTTTSNAGDVIKYRVLKKITVDPFEPKIPKLPFGIVVCNDLNTTIGSTILKLVNNDLLTYGTTIGDTIRILNGAFSGDYIISGFDSVLGGKGPIINTPATSSESFLNYEVFTLQSGTDRPLVRIKQLLLLDSSNQSTGITIPPAEPVAVVPVDQFTSARVRASSALNGGYVLPDFTGYVTGGNIAAIVASGNDYRYSAGFDIPNGIYRAVQFTDVGTHQSEFDFRSDANGVCSWFLATAENLDPLTGQLFPPINPVIGDCLTISSGPNTGSYLVKNVVKFKFLDSNSIINWCYFIQIYGLFPVDILKQLITFLDTTAVTSGNATIGITKLTGATVPTFPDFFRNTYNSLGTKLDLALTFYGATSPGATILQSMVDSVAKVKYAWGDAAKGSLRTYFTDPTAFEQWTALNNILTTYNYTNPSGGIISFIPTPNAYDRTQLIPARLTDDTDPKNYPRDYDASVTTTPTFTDAIKPTVFSAGVEIGDVLSINYETFLGATGNKLSQAAIGTVTGSNQITFYNMNIQPTLVGSLLSIEEGTDKNMYRVTRYISPNAVTLDTSLKTTTPTVLASGTVAQWGATAPGTNKVVASTTNLSTFNGKWMTIYGINYNYQGSFQIVAVNQGSPQGVLLDRTIPSVGDFLTFPQTGGFLVITNAPITTPTISTVGIHATELFGLRPVRIYQGNSTDLSIASVNTSLTISQVTTTAAQDGYNNPYKIYRKNVRRITPSQMASNQDGPLYYFDTDVISLSPQIAANISKDNYLTIEPGTYKSFGYTFSTQDNTLSYSTQEEGSLVLPLKLLPVNSSDSSDNYINLFASPVQISYERAQIVQDFQDFLDSPDEKVVAANMLARHFLPSYVSYDASYFGSGIPSDLANSIISYINTLPIETAVDVSVIEGIIIDGGGNPETPTKIIVISHDWDRRIWASFSENKIGGTTMPVPMNGTGRVSYFTAGPDVSGQSPVPPGERINLIKE